jgi:hypothetical protein
MIKLNGLLRLPTGFKGSGRLCAMETPTGDKRADIASAQKAFLVTAFIPVFPVPRSRAAPPSRWPSVIA